MKARAIAILLTGVAAFTLTAPVSAQGTLGSSNRRTVQQPNAPVTRKEASTIVSRMDQVIRRVVLKSNVKGSSKIPADDKPVQRGEILKEFNRLFEMCKPKFKFSPDMTAYDAKDFTVGNDANAKAMAGKLVSWGAVGRVAALVSSSKPTMTVAEFGDAVGFFLLRMSELTHKPSVRFSPPMMDGGGG